MMKRMRKASAIFLTSAICLTSIGSNAFMITSYAEETQESQQPSVTEGTPSVTGSTSTPGNTTESNTLGTAPQDSTPTGGDITSGSKEGESTDPTGTTPEGSAPGGALPEGTTPGEIKTEGTELGMLTPDSVTPGDTLPDGNTLDPATPDNLTPEAVTGGITPVTRATLAMGMNDVELVNLLNDSLEAGANGTTIDDSDVPTEEDTTTPVSYTIDPNIGEDGSVVIYFNIPADAQGDLKVPLSKAIMEVFKGYEINRISPGEVFPLRIVITIDGENKHTFQYKDGSFIMTSADMSNEEAKTGIEDGAGNDLPVSLLTPLTQNMAIQNLLGRNAKLEDLLKIYEKLADKGFTNPETALTDYFIWYYNNYNSTTGKKLPESAKKHYTSLEEIKTAEPALYQEIIAGGNVNNFVVSTKDYEKMKNKYGDFLSKYVVVTQQAYGRYALQIKWPEQDLAATTFNSFYEDYFNIIFDLGDGAMDALEGITDVNGADWSKSGTAIYDYLNNAKTTWPSFVEAYNQLMGQYDTIYESERSALYMALFDQGYQIYRNTHPFGNKRDAERAAEEYATRYTTAAEVERKTMKKIVAEAYKNAATKDPVGIWDYINENFKKLTADGLTGGNEEMNMLAFQIALGIDESVPCTYKCYKYAFLSSIVLEQVDGGISVDKVDVNGNKITTGETGFNLYYISVEDSQDVTYYYHIDENGIVSFTTNKADAAILLTVGGTLDVQYLLPNTYYLQEILEPDGYTLNPEALEILVEKGAITYATFTDTGLPVPTPEPTPGPRSGGRGGTTAAAAAAPAVLGATREIPDEVTPLADVVPVTDPSVLGARRGVQTADYSYLLAALFLALSAGCFVYSRKEEKLQ